MTTPDSIDYRPMPGQFNGLIRPQPPPETGAESRVQT
jgi:hypothetical protein